LYLLSVRSKNEYGNCTGSVPCSNKVVVKRYNIILCLPNSNITVLKKTGELHFPLAGSDRTAAEIVKIMT
jgi:hypothetical protein